MKNIGFGKCSFGKSRFGYGSIAVGNPPSLALADGTPAFSVETGQAIIDWTTGQPEMMTIAQEMVFLSLRTRLGESAVSDLGQSFTSVKVLGDGAQNMMESKVRAALDYPISTGIIRLNHVTVDRRGPTGIFLIVNWTDLANDSAYNTSLSLG